MVTTEPRRMTAEEFLALPVDDDVERCLIDGYLRETAMTRRNRWHSQIMARFSRFLDEWRDLQPEPRGMVACGEVGCWLSRDPVTLVGIDVAYFDAATMARTTIDSTMIEGPPIVAVEILSPSDTIADIDERIDLYLGAGVRQVWIVDPHDRTVTVHRPDQEHRPFTQSQELDGEPDLPGFRVAVARLFGA
jgi:Uma2 family endonuclease